MLPVKASYGDMYENKTCCLCQEEDETQKHVLCECKIIKENAKHIEYIKYFMEDARRARRPDSDGRNEHKSNWTTRGW